MENKCDEVQMRPHSIAFYQQGLDRCAFTTGFYEIVIKTRYLKHDSYTHTLKHSQ